MATTRKQWWQFLAEESQAWRELLAQGFELGRQRLELDQKAHAADQDRLQRLEQLVHTVGVDILAEVKEELQAQKQRRARAQAELEQIERETRAAQDELERQRQGARPGPKPEGQG